MLLIISEINVVKYVWKFRNFIIFSFSLNFKKEKKIIRKRKM